MQDKTGILEVNMKNILIVTGHTHAKDSIGMFNTSNSTPEEKLSMGNLAKTLRRACKPYRFCFMRINKLA